MLDGKVLKILRAQKEITFHQDVPGTLQTDHKKTMKYATLDGYVQVLELQLEGRKRMDVAAFLNGYRIGSD
jgi:methionyl-tRNA formyltransferase